MDGAGEFEKICHELAINSLLRGADGVCRAYDAFEVGQGRYSLPHSHGIVADVSTADT